MQPLNIPSPSPRFLPLPPEIIKSWGKHEIAIEEVTRAKKLKALRVFSPREGRLSRPELCVSCSWFRCVMYLNWASGHKAKADSICTRWNQEGITLLCKPNLSLRESGRYPCCFCAHQSHNPASSVHATFWVKGRPRWWRPHLFPLCFPGATTVNLL